MVLKMTISTISWTKGKIRIIDQNKLPVEFSYIYCEDLKSVINAIKSMKIRGAPLLGIAAALGLVLAIQNVKGDSYQIFKKALDKASLQLANTRPTAINLFFSIERIRKKAEENKNKKFSVLKRILLEEALEMLREDKKLCRAIGGHGAKLINQKDSVLTYCNAGALATVDYGTALGVIYSAKKKSKFIKVYACETRPKLQGSRLTSWELLRNKIDVTLICDNMAADIMKKKLVNKVIVGADRIALNGDTANKIGTYSLALLAKMHKIPFYVVAPLSTVDSNLKNGKRIPIEERSPDEIVKGFGKRTAPEDVKVYNPAFDVTPSEYITAIITEKGVIRPPYFIKLRRLINLRDK